MLKILAYIFVSSFVVLFNVECAKILAVFPYPGPGHFIAVQPYLRELILRGHEVTLINNYFLNSSSTPFRDVQLIYKDFEELITANIQVDETYQHQLLSQYHSNVTLMVLEHEQVAQFLFKQNATFDMVITDILMPSALYGIATHFNAHLVGISSTSSELHIDNLVGNDSPLSFVPVDSSGIIGPMNFFERVQNLGQAWLEWLWIYIKEWSAQRKLYHKFFPHLTSPFGKVCRNFSLILVNQHFSIGVPRPYVPNMIEVGGMYISDTPGTMPKDILDFINGAEDGVIYFSMGTHIKLRTFPENKFEALLDFFYSTKMRILWKFESPEMSGVPKNVFVRKWFPQRAILAHPKVKLFMTHGGFLSVMEAIYSAKPVVGIPTFFNHAINMKRIMKFGMGETVSYDNLSERNLTKAVDMVLTNEEYAQNAQIMQRRFKDRPTSPLNTAIFWTEYILRQNGAEFMRVAAKDMNFIQYYNIDVISLICFVFCIFIIIQCQCMKRCGYATNHAYKILSQKIQQARTARQQAAQG